MQLNQGPNQGTNAVILYHIGSEQLRKCYDNFGEIILVCVATYLTKTDKDSWKGFLITCLYNLFWILLMDPRTWLIAVQEKHC